MDKMCNYETCEYKFEVTCKCGTSYELMTKKGTSLLTIYIAFINNICF